MSGVAYGDAPLAYGDAPFFCPGFYIIISDVAVDETLQLGAYEDMICVLTAGETVTVLEVARTVNRVRGRFEMDTDAGFQSGWFSIMDTDDGYRWAQKIVQVEDPNASYACAEAPPTAAPTAERVRHALEAGDWHGMLEAFDAEGGPAVCPILAQQCAQKMYEIEKNCEVWDDVSSISDSSEIPLEDEPLEEGLFGPQAVGAPTGAEDTEVDSDEAIIPARPAKTHRDDDGEDPDDEAIDNREQDGDRSDDKSDQNENVEVGSRTQEQQSEDRERQEEEERESQRRADESRSQEVHSVATADNNVGFVGAVVKKEQERAKGPVKKEQKTHAIEQCQEQQLRLVEQSLPGADTTPKKGLQRKKKVGQNLVDANSDLAGSAPGTLKCSEDMLPTTTSKLGTDKFRKVKHEKRLERENKAKGKAEKHKGLVAEKYIDEIHDNQPKVEEANSGGTLNVWAWGLFLDRHEQDPGRVRAVMAMILMFAVVVESALALEGVVKPWAGLACMIIDFWIVLDALVRFPAYHTMGSFFIFKQLLFWTLKTCVYRFGMTNISAFMVILALNVWLPVLYLMAFPLSPAEQILRDDAYTRDLAAIRAASPATYGTFCEVV